MAYNKVTIDVEARFVDDLSNDAKSASKSVDNLGKEAQEAAKEVDKLGKKKVKPKVDADTSSVTKKISKIDRMLAKLGRSKTETKLSALDRATAKINKVKESLKTLTWKSHNILLKTNNSDALRTLNNMSGKIKSITSKTWSAAIKIKDGFTKPLSALKNSLFSIRTLIAGIASAWAAVKFVKEPIALADAYSSAKIGFSTLLGESQGQQMMNDLDEFAKATPFKSSEVIGQTQRMLAMGWDAENIIDDMTTIGDAAAATGKGQQGLQQIVTALAQIKTKGRLSTEELNQLAEAGISAKKYLAEGLGYGSGDKGIAKMTKDLEDGAISSGKALEALLSGMKEYQGMMDQTANETVRGLWSQIEDTFEINIARRWGQGLQDGAKDAFGSIVTLIDEADGALTKFGDTVYDVGKKISTWAADKLKNTVERITEITGSYEFKNASLGGKISMLWNGVVADPLSEWWEGGGREKTAETAGKIGSWMGEMLTKGLLALFGATDILDEGIGTEAGSSIAGSFLEGFLDNFDGSAITQAFVDAIGNVWGALPWWAKLLIGGYGVGKAAGGFANFAGGVLNFAGGVKNVVGGFDIASSAFPILTSSGSGLLGLAGKAGVRLGASTAGKAMLMGGAGIAGGLAGGASIIKGGMDLYGSYKAYKAGDEIEGKAKTVSGTATLTGVMGGAAIGSFLGPLGALVGAGIGGVVGWFMGGKAADDIRATDDAVNDITASVEDLETEEEKLAQQNKLVWQNMKDHFGDIKLSIAEIQRLAEQIVWGDDMGQYEQFASATKQAQASLETLKSSAESTNRWMWKAGLGVKFNDDEIETIKESFDEYISSAKSYVENKHYEFTAAVSLLVDVESKEGKAILESGNAFYTKMQKQLDDLGGKLSETVEIALEDGVITLDEEKEIINLQNQIATITEKISNAEAKAELELIKVKFGSGNLDMDSFDSFMEQMKTTLSERMAANDEAFTASVASLDLQLAEGAITEEEYNKQLQTLIDGYTGKVETIKAEILGVELDIIGEAYADEGVTADKLRLALEKSLEDGIDPIDWTVEDARKYLGLDELSESSALAIAQMLGGVADQLELVEVDGKLLLDLGVETEGDTGTNVVEKVKNLVPEMLDTHVSVNITAEENIENNIDILAEEFGIPKSMAETILWKLSGTKTIENKIDLICTEFGIGRTQAESILWKLSGLKQIENKISLTSGDFGIMSSYSFSPTVNITAKKGTVTPIRVSTHGLATQEFRGGIVGGSSSMEAFYRGGIASYSDGGIVRGGSKLITVAEEGSPEMIIPLSDQRRDRALKLWEKAGQMLDVPGFSRGGRTDGGSDEGIRFRGYDSGGASGGQTIQVSVAGITIEVHVNSDGSTNIVEAIKSQVGVIADAVVGEIAAQLGEIFENTPVRGGAA